MRWRSNAIRAFKDGETVTFHKFLLLPKRIGGEWRWLENVDYQARAYHSYTGACDRWEDVKWVNS